MKYLVLLLLISGCSSSRLKRMKSAELNYNAGCLLTSIHLCNKYGGKDKFTCYGEQDVACPLEAKNFRKWLENGKPN